MNERRTTVNATSKQHHVIFLGAGASYTSGYPVGNGLRLRLSSQELFFADLKAAMGEIPPGIEEAWKPLLDGFKDSMSLFREGAFATVDEFSKLASKDFPAHVRNMKLLTRLALSFHNPEDNFEKSDYYPFVQRLFQDVDISALKPSVTILSYN